MTEVTKTITLGIEDLKISELLKDDATGVEYDSPIDVPGVKELGITLTLDDKELTGDEMTLDVFSKVQSLEVNFKNAELTPEIMCLINGSEVKTVTEDKQDVIIIEDSALDQSKYFALEFQPARTVGNGDYHRLLYKVSGRYQEEYTEGDYMVCSFSGKAVARSYDKKFGAKKFYKTKKTDIKDIAAISTEPVQVNQTEPVQGD